MAEGRLLANSLLSATPLPNHLHLISSTGKQAPLPPPSSLGQNRAWLSETHPKAGTWHSTGHCRPDVWPCLGGVIKIREGNEEEIAQICPRFPVCFLQPWGAAWGIPLQDPMCHMADATGFKRKPEAPPNPHPAPAATCSLSACVCPPGGADGGVS